LICRTCTHSTSSINWKCRSKTKKKDPRSHTTRGQACGPMRRLAGAACTRGAPAGRARAPQGRTAPAAWPPPSQRAGAPCGRARAACAPPCRPSSRSAAAPGCAVRPAAPPPPCKAARAQRAVPGQSFGRLDSGSRSSGMREQQLCTCSHANPKDALRPRLCTRLLVVVVVRAQVRLQLCSVLVLLMAHLRRAAAKLPRATPCDQAKVHHPSAPLSKQQ